MTMTIEQIRDELINEYVERATSETLGGTIELIGTSFHATEPAILGTPDQDYIRREIEWYHSQSLSVREFPGGAPRIWREVASRHGEINSNYGYLLFSRANGHQYSHVLNALSSNPEGRQATAVYTRPSIHADATRDGMRDFICTNAVCYFIRGGALHAVVQMRSNDVVFGYRNDYAWQVHVQRMLIDDLALDGVRVHPGSITWQAASLHVYKRHYPLIEELIR